RWSGIPESAAGIALGGDVARLTALADEDESLVLLENLLDVRSLVAGLEQEERGLRPRTLVLPRADVDPFRTVDVRALADQVEPARREAPLRRCLGEPLVRLSKEIFVGGKTFFTIHGSRV